MKVTNVNGTSANTCKCGSWLKHWRRYSGEALPSDCPVTGCWRPPEVGAHVQKENSYDDRWYIVPLCIDHNNGKGKTLSISDSVALVPANVSQTCGRGY